MTSIVIGEPQVRKWQIQARSWLPLAESVAASVVADVPAGTNSGVAEPLSGGSKRQLAEQLFDNAAYLKIDMSRIAMHLESKWRDSIRKQIDRLLSSDSWEDDSSEIDRDSFRTFLRFLVFSSPDKLAGLGVSAGGDILAAWHSGRKKVSVEFAGCDKANAFLFRPTERASEVIAWSGHVGELLEFIDRVGYMDCLQKDSNGEEAQEGGATSSP